MIETVSSFQIPDSVRDKEEERDNWIKVSCFCEQIRLRQSQTIISIYSCNALKKKLECNKMTSY